MESQVPFMSTSTNMKVKSISISVHNIHEEEVLIFSNAN